MTKNTATAALAKSTTTEEQRRGLIETVAVRYGIEPKMLLDTLKATVFPTAKDGSQATNEQLAAYLIVANRYELNPFTREIYAFPGKNGGIVPIVGVDGWASIINRQPQLDGIEFEDHFEEKNGSLSAITCTIYRKDRAKPTVVTEYMKECKRDTEPWNRWPARMLRHKALIQCARYAFSLSGLMDEDEAERSAENDSLPRTRMIGGNGKTLDATASAPDATLAKIRGLCVKLGLNTAQENHFIGQYEGRLEDLVRDLETKLEGASSTEPAGEEAPEPAKRQTSSASPSAQTPGLGF